MSVREAISRFLTPQPAIPAAAARPTHRTGSPATAPVRAQPSRRQPTDDATRDAGDASLGKCERAVLGVLAQFPDGCEAGKLALLSGYRWTGGFRNALSTLRTAGVLIGRNSEVMRASEELRDAASG